MRLEKITVGEYQSNCYLLLPEDSAQAVLIDPGAEAGKILEWIRGRMLAAILITHGHHDHVGALQSVRSATRAPVGIHPADADRFHLAPDFILEDGAQLEYAGLNLQVVHVPGHTPGSVAFLLSDPAITGQALVGDAIFPGGPGHTETPEDLSRLLEALNRNVFIWPDATQLHPGHGKPTTVGDERGPFLRFLESDRPDSLCGDVTWS